MKKELLTKITALTLIISDFSLTQAAYVMYVPTEVKLGGSLPDGSIQFVSATEEPTTPVEPEEPQPVITHIDLIKKYKYFNSTNWPLTETRNTSKFNTIAGGFKYEMLSGSSTITYTFTAGKDSTGYFQDGKEFENFTPPKVLKVDFPDGIANCTGSGTGMYVPFTGSQYGSEGGTYRTSYKCDVRLAGVMAQPTFMNLTFIEE